MSDGEPRGWLNTGARLVRVLLSDPNVRRDIDTVARHVDPDAAPELVRSALWTDPGVTATILAVAPDVLNAAIEAGWELGRQTRRLPPALVHATTEELLSKVRFHRLGLATGQWMAWAIGWLRARASREDDAWHAWAAGVLEALREAGLEPAEVLEIPLEAVADRLERAVRDNPEAVRRATSVVRRVAERHPDLVAAMRGEGEEEAR